MPKLPERSRADAHVAGEQLAAMSDTGLRAALSSGRGVVAHMAASSGRIVSYGMFGLPAQTAAGMRMEWPVLIGAIITATSSRIWVLSAANGEWSVSDLMATARIPWDLYRGRPGGPRNVANGHIVPPPTSISVESAIELDGL